ncbi:MAG: hypothetical protein JST22_18755 [Bacteroidetes bacterium]|nr:hypothetical protein [Bacteroidota bacterium]
MQRDRSRSGATYFCFVLLFLSGAMAAALGNGVDAAPSLAQVEFSGSGRILLRPDPTPELPFAELPARWKAGQPVLSVAYVSGSYPEVGATIEMAHRSFTTRVLMRGHGPDGMAFPPLPAVVRESGGTTVVIYPPHPSTIPFDPGTVCCYDPFTISWEFSADDGTTWTRAGESSATIYVTRGRPAPENPEMGFGYIESLFDISCRSAHGYSSEADIVQHVWSEFTDLVVRTKKGDTLSFYPHKQNNQQETTAGLILCKSGVCFAWAHLLIDLLRIQGITRRGSYVVLSAPNTASCGPVIGMLMPNCTFGTPSAAATCPDFPYLAAFARPLTGDLIGPDVFSKPGLAGQGEPDPMSLFHDHALVLIDGVYYDPSYGRTFASLDEFVNSIAGWAVESVANESQVHFDLNGNHRIEDLDVKVARVSNDPHRCRLSVARSDY